MEAKLKAKEIIEKFECYVDYQGDDCFTEREKMLINAKRCALIAVDEILKSHYGLYSWINKATYKYWVEVKEAIISYENNS